MSHIQPPEVLSLSIIEYSNTNRVPHCHQNSQKDRHAWNNQANMLVLGAVSTDTFLSLPPFFLIPCLAPRSEYK